MTPVTLTIDSYSPTSPTTKFTLSGLTGLTGISVKAMTKNQTADFKNIPELTALTAEEYTQDMRMIIPEGSSFITRANAMKAFNDGQAIEIDSSSTGTIEHTALANYGLNYSLGQFFSNNLYINFVPAVVRFDDNSVALGGDTAAQNLGYSNFALNGAIDNDDFNTGELPSFEKVTKYELNIDGEQVFDDNGDPIPVGEYYKGDSFATNYVVGEKYTIGGKEYTFYGWNTEADGKGAYVAADTVISKSMFNSTGDQDLELFAIWTLEATHEFVSATAGKDLPAEVMALLSADQEGIVPGTTVAPTALEITEVKVAGGTWKFVAWTPESAVAGTDELKFVGSWEFVEDPVEPSETETQPSETEPTETETQPTEQITVPTTKPSVNATPKTGDATYYGMIAMVAVSAAIVLIVVKRKVRTAK